MNNFTPRKLEPEENVGEKLRQARLFKNYKIENVAKKISIRADYLTALEEEHFESLPTGLYGRNYLKKYSAYLGLNTKEILESWDKYFQDNTTNDPFSKRVVKRSRFIVFPKIVRNTLIVIAVAICFLYLIFYFKKIVFPPFLVITQPEKNMLIHSNSILVTGETAKEAEIKINGEIVLNNQNGAFSQTINLKQGLNNIVIKSKKKYSREKTVTRQILVE